MTKHQIKQQNNHARRKQKRKKLRLKNFWQRVLDYRYEKQKKANKPRGITITREAKEFARRVPYGLFSHSVENVALVCRSQRKRRKLARQMGRKVA